MAYGRKKTELSTCGQLLLALLMIMLTPLPSFSVELIHTIQIGSHRVEQRAERQYNSVQALLPEEERDSLRIEKIGGYYALRLGSFTRSQEAEELLVKVRSTYPGAATMTAYISQNRLLKIYRPAAEAAPAPAPLPVQTESVPVEIIVETRVEPPPVAVETLVPAVLELQAEPVPVEPTIEPPQLTVASPAPAVVVERQEQPMLPETLKGEARQTEVSAAAAEPAVEMNPQPVIETAAVIEPLVAVDKVATQAIEVIAVKQTATAVAATNKLFSPNQLILGISALTLGLLVLTVRALKSPKTAPLCSPVADELQSPATTAAVDVPEEEQAQTEKSPEGETHASSREDTARIPAGLVTNKELAVSIAEKPTVTPQSDADQPPAVETIDAAMTEDSAVETEAEISLATNTVAADFKTTPPTEDDAADRPREERQNRLSRAMEAAMFDGKYKR